MLKTICLIFILLFSSQLQAREWVKYSSENFTLYSDGRSERVVNSLKEFEAFRIVSLALLGLKNVPENQKMTIFMYAANKDFNKIKPGRNIAGFFYNSSMGPRLIIGPARRGIISTKEILYHEYVHFLMSDKSDFSYPRWYGEGFADLLSTMELSSDETIVGRSPENRADWLRNTTRVPIEDLVDFRNIEDNSPDFEGKFYATSWLLAHYIFFEGYSGNTELQQQTLDYLRRFNAGDDPSEAFFGAFETTENEMDREISIYQSKNRVNLLTLGSVEYSGEIIETALTAVETAFLLSDIASDMSENEVSLDILTDITESESDGSGSARIYSSRGIMKFIFEDFDAAQLDINKAIELGSQDSLALRDICSYYHYKYDRSVEEGFPNKPYLEKAIEFGEQAIAVNPEEFSAYRSLGFAYESNNNIQKAVDTLLNAYELNQSDNGLNMLLARVLVKGRQFDLAGVLIEKVYNTTHSFQERARVQQILDQVKEGDVDLSLFSSTGEE